MTFNAGAKQVRLAPFLQAVESMFVRLFMKLSMCGIHHLMLSRLVPSHLQHLCCQHAHTNTRLSRQQIIMLSYGPPMAL